MAFNTVFKSVFHLSNSCRCGLNPRRPTYPLTRVVCQAAGLMIEFEPRGCHQIAANSVRSRISTSTNGLHEIIVFRSVVLITQNAIWSVNEAPSAPFEWGLSRLVASVPSSSLFRLAQWGALRTRRMGMMTASNQTRANGHEV